jgi:hypothetical protein
MCSPFLGGGQYSYRCASVASACLESVQGVGSNNDVWAPLISGVCGDMQYGDRVVFGCTVHVMAKGGRCGSS